MNPLRHLLDIIFPHYCAVCGCRLQKDEGCLCPSCLMSLPYEHVRDFSDNGVSRMFWGKFPLQRAFSYMIYRHDDGSHSLLMQMKYHHRPDVAQWAGKLMADDLLREGFFQGIDAIVPVPLHWLRRLRRGYNQSQLLAEGISEATGIPVHTDSLRRLRNNVSQTSLSHQSRLQSVQDIFEAPQRYTTQHLLLVDDVVTTGATLTACAQALLKQNPNVQISILTLAHA